MSFRQSDSSDKIGSDSKAVDRILDLESGTVHELSKLTPGMWRYPKNCDLCCIYRVPCCLREVNPKAYTPQLVLIGPLHYCLKSQALKSLGDPNMKSMGYLNMEEHKKFYLREFAKRVEGKKHIDEFRRMIEEDEDMIRASYSESTVWIQSPKFVEMILHDSVFILEIMLRFHVQGPEKIGDTLMDEPCLENKIKVDLMLLENQLPYFILEKLFEPIVKRLCPDQTFKELVIFYFGFQTKIGKESTFRHFTDLFRCVSVETLPERDVDESKSIDNLHNADKLHSRGIKFEVLEEKTPYVSIDVSFKKGCLTLPCFFADGDVEVTLRNIMALEQCHYPFEAHVCNYIIFLDYLIDTEKDVELLVEREIIKNWLGHPGLVAKMVNNLCSGVMDLGSYYSHIAKEVLEYYKNECVKSRSSLKNVYFSNKWRGTATIASAFLLLLTLIQTVTSIIDALPTKNPSP